MSTDSIPQAAPPVKLDLDLLWAQYRQSFDEVLRLSILITQYWQGIEQAERAGNAQEEAEYYELWRDCRAQKPAAVRAQGRAQVTYTSAFIAQYTAEGEGA